MTTLKSLPGIHGPREWGWWGWSRRQPMGQVEGNCSCGPWREDEALGITEWLLLHQMYPGVLSAAKGYPEGGELF